MAMLEGFILAKGHARRLAELPPRREALTRHRRPDKIADILDDISHASSV
jgi:hypothetical protein